MAHGHRWHDIQNYTWRQMQLFFREAVRRDQRARADRMEDVAAALSKDLPRAVKQLRGS